MARKIIGMITSYPGVEQCDWSWHQSPNSFGVWNNIQVMAKHPDPDFLLLYNFAQLPPRKHNKLIFKNINYSEKLEEYQQNLEQKFRGVPKERRIFIWREPPLEYLNNYNRTCYQWAQEYCGYVSAADDVAPISEYMPAIWYHLNTFRDFNELPPPEKIKLCSWITSGVSRSENHLKRLEFLRLIQSSGSEIDYYGRNMPDWSKSSGYLANKWYGMAPYYYNLTIENFADNDWYLSEKMWDALLAWCLPIYYGGTAADKVLPPGSFLRIPSLDEKGIAYIKEIIATPDAWHQAKEAIAEARQLVLHKLNLVNWLSEYVEKCS
ncbi:conserved hypothetical protein [Planktothrix sp. PCC 11201]|uniref:glycosyltransferase family 10 domain-containing protein n=1 Tax=Planktothrix sp. PCC 11201 TaxID=1729650 RepID=UPI000924715A|nr:glycosyltransferase family 10 [Planktothrix sp. PCC 11201]SKB14659.1 conserved hypothetical protein [Planktothrix sp. PCC 11201]